MYKSVPCTIYLPRLSTCVFRLILFALEVRTRDPGQHRGGGRGAGRDRRWWLDAGGGGCGLQAGAVPPAPGTHQKGHHGRRKRKCALHHLVALGYVSLLKDSVRQFKNSLLSPSLEMVRGWRYAASEVAAGPPAWREEAATKLARNAPAVVRFACRGMGTPGGQSARGPRVSSEPAGKPLHYAT